MKANLLFDMGNVLIRWSPETFTERLGLAPTDAALLIREVYGDVEWVQLDRGAVTEAQVVRSVCDRVPARLHRAVERLVSHWDEPPLSVPGMYELVRDLDAAGYGLYLLSNAGPRHREYWPNWPVSAFFGDRKFISAENHILKPDPVFYRRALARFHLDGSSCLFVDDNPLNVEAALYMGIGGGIVFHGGAADLRRKLKTYGIEVPAEPEK